MFLKTSGFLGKEDGAEKVGKKANFKKDKINLNQRKQVNNYLYIASVQPRKLFTHKSQLSAEQRQIFNNCQFRRIIIVIFVTTSNFIKGKILMNTVLGSWY